MNHSNQKKILRVGLLPMLMTIYGLLCASPARCQSNAGVGWRSAVTVLK